jgi:hypothetical protein
MWLWQVVFCLLLVTSAQAQEAPRLGVFGTVENAAPLIVAGREIVVPIGLGVISPLGPGQVILQGDTLAVRAALVDGQLVAERMMQVFPVIGPMRVVAGTLATIMGTQVDLSPDLAAADGQWVAVSGLWSGERVVATHLRRVESSSFAQLVGAVDPDTGRIGGSSLKGGQAPADGYGSDIWSLSGAPDAEGLRIALQSKGAFGRPVELELWQGYASPPVASQTYVIHGAGITGTARDAQMPQSGALIMRCVHQGRVVHEAPDGFDAAFSALTCARHTPAE